MANYRANDVIRLTRKAVGLSQEAISEGICSVETFSRIERGKTKIKGDTYKKIMERLERNTDKFYAVCSGEDVDLLDDVAAIENAIAKFDYQLADSILGNVRENIGDTPENKHGLEKTHDRLRVSDHFHFKEEIELIENIMNFSQAKVLLRTNICKENKDEIIALHKYIFEKFGNERIEINPNRTIKYHQDDSFEMLSVQEYAEVAYQIKLLWSEQKGKFELPVPRSTPCKFPYGNAYAISPEGYCTFCSGSMDQEKKYFFDVDIENKKMFSVRKECKKCNILPLCLGGGIIQYNLRAGACTYEKYELKNILISYIKHIS